VAAGRPDDAILDAARMGVLDLATRDKLAPVAAAAANTRDYLVALARDSQNLMLSQWHRVVPSCADGVLDSLREKFDRHAAAIAVARDLFTAETTAEQVLAGGVPEAMAAWQELTGHVKVIAQIARVATQFGPRLGWFPQVTEYHLADNHVLVDAALCCTNGNLVADSVMFGRRDPMQHRDSPFFAVPLKLHTIAEMKDRYRAFAEAEHDRVHSRDQGGVLVDGIVVPNARPVNPFRRQEASV
jgi:hypothetical protein